MPTQVALHHSWPSRPDCQRGAQAPLPSALNKAMGKCLVLSARENTLLLILARGRAAGCKLQVQFCQGACRPAEECYGPTKLGAAAWLLFPQSCLHVCTRVCSKAARRGADTYSLHRFPSETLNWHWNWLHKIAFSLPKQLELKGYLV